MNYLPFNSVDHDRVYKAEDWAWYFSTFIKNGVFPAPANGLQVLAGSGMTVTVNPGFGFINGYAYRNQEVYAVPVSTADGALGRIDRVVLRWDLTTRSMYIAILEGTASRSPEAPALTRGAEVWELALADIEVSRGLTTITQAQIKDDRYNSALCGICAGVIDQIDASTLTKQFNAFFDQYTATILSDYDAYTASIENYEEAWKAALDEWKAAEQKSLDEWQATQWSSFNEWLDSVQNALGEEAAAALAATASDHETRVSLLEHMVLNNDFFAPVVDDDGSVILDDSGDALVGEWKYKYL